MDDKDLSQLPNHLSKLFIKNRDESLDYVLGQNFASSKLSDDSFIKTIVKISLNSIYGLFFKMDNVHILRAVEPGLRLRYAIIDCKKISHPDDLLKPLLFRQCIEKRNFNTGTRSQLGEFILNYVKKNNKP